MKGGGGFPFLIDNNMPVKLYKDGSNIIYDDSAASRVLNDASQDVRVWESTTQEGLGDYWISSPKIGTHRLVIGPDLQDSFGTPPTSNDHLRELIANLKG